MAGSPSAASAAVSPVRQARPARIPCGACTAAVLLVLWLAAMLVSPGRALADGELTYDGCLANNVAGCADVPGDPLKGATSVAVSPNGASVYVASLTSNTVSHLFRGAEGRVGWDGCVSNDGAGGFCADIPGTGTPLSGASGVAVSPNSASVYVVATLAGTVSHLFADPQQGQISWDGCVSSDGSGGTCADVPGTASPLQIAWSVAVSPNGGSVYVVSLVDPFGLQGAVSHLFAAPQGQLTWDGCVNHDGFGGNCADIPGAGTPLTDAGGVAVSPNGASVFVGSSVSTSHLFANPQQGQISWDGCVSNDGSGGTCLDIPGAGAPLSGISAVAVSPDGRSLYAASAGGDAILHYALDSDGRLAYRGCWANDGSQGCVDLPNAPLDAPRGVAVSPDGRSVYVASLASASISHFARDDQGGLAFQGCLADDAAQGCTDLPNAPLTRASSVAVSPDGASVYVTGETPGAIAHFFRVRAAGPGTGGPGGSGGSGGGGSGGSGGGPGGSGGGGGGGPGGGGGGGGKKRYRCGGKAATLIGTPRKDVLRGTAKADAIVGLGGKDRISGLGGNDRLCGGTGADQMFGEAGADRLYGADGSDWVSGGAGGDRLYGQDGRDLVSGGTENDSLWGGAARDDLHGGPGLDSLDGGPGLDTLNGGRGKDRCAGRRDKKQSC